MIGKGLSAVLCSALVGVVAMLAPGLAEAASITEFATGVTSPGSMVNGSDGNVWFINGDGVAKIDSSGHVTTYVAGLDPGASPYDLTAGPNGDLWFTDNGAKAVGYITPGGSIHEFLAPAGDTPLQMAAGSDGNIWFYSTGVTPALVKMTPGGSFTGYAMPMNGEIDDNMVLGPDGDIWFSDAGTTAIGKIAPNGSITEYPLTRMGAFPTNITVGPDGNLWFSDNSGAIGRITTSGSLQEFSSGLQTGAIPDAITAGPDGNVWFTDQYSGQREIGRITPSGQITEFDSGLNVDLPLDITVGADGNLWVPQASMGSATPSAIAQITPSGQITEITQGVNPDGLQDGDSILAATNGSLWFTDNASSPKALGRIILAPLASSGPATGIAITSATVSGFVTPLAAATTVSIDYGTTPAFGSVTSLGSLAAGTTKQAVTASLAGLPSGTTIYYRVVATNSAGEADGGVESFTTASPPPAALPPSPQITTVSLDNQQIALTTPPVSVCTASTAKLAVTLNSTAVKGSKKARLRFSNAGLFIDKGIKHTTRKTVRKHGKRVKVTVVSYRANAVVTKLPASPLLKLAGLKSGQHVLKVALSYKQTVVKHGHKSTRTVIKTLRARFAVC